jgi:hypothetical protein
LVIAVAVQRTVTRRGVIIPADRAILFTTALRIYTTTDVTKRRIYTLMHDPTYRAQVNFEQSTYNQPPHTGFQISPNMPAPPVPNIFIAGQKK